MYNYKNYKKLLTGLANKAGRKLNESTEDMLGEANVIFSQCIKEYKEDSTVAFTTFLYTSVLNNFKNMYTAKVRENRKQKKYYHVEAKKQPVHNDVHFSIIEMSVLSKNANIISMLCLHPPVELLQLSKYYTSDNKKVSMKITKEMLIEYTAKAYNWNRRECNTIFTELQQFVA